MDHTVNFNSGIENIANTVIQSSPKRPDKVFGVHVISDGDPLEIYTDREGEVIFKKYSPIGELVDFASQYAESLYKTCGIPVAVCDRDSVVAVSGISRKEFLDKKISATLDGVIENRSLYTAERGSDKRVSLTDDEQGGISVICAQPIFAEGDIIGCVAAVSGEEAYSARTDSTALETEVKLIRTAAAFLGRQLES